MSSITSWPSASIPGVVIPANSPPSDDRQNSIGTDSILRDRPRAIRWLQTCTAGLFDLRFGLFRVR